MKDKNRHAAAARKHLNLVLWYHRSIAKQIIVQDGKPADTELTAFTLFVWCPFLFIYDKEETDMNRKEIESILKDYRWMMNSIQVLRESLEDAGEGLTANTGLRHLYRRRKALQAILYITKLSEGRNASKIEIYEQKVQKLQERISRISDERETRFTLAAGR
ncbi:hypothetical protein PO124_28065 [Bacillus licheniformis]|nr:hypothetical protein [Bacillus licheniformis]